MILKKLLFFFCLKILIFNNSQNINHCIKYNEIDAYNTCTKCQDKYFLFFHNLYCLPCDDPIYGQEGCQGNCDSSRYNITRKVFCNENNCKEGYYYLDGICFNCSTGSPGCKKCKIQVENEQKYICEECLNNQYILNERNICEECSVEKCEKCHFNNSKAICDKCFDGFYINSFNQCQKCKYPISIPNGYCQICSDEKENYLSGECWCDDYFTIFNHSNCIHCPNNCSKCEYNNQTNEIECIRCDPGFTINNNKKCSFCGEGCEYCLLDKNLKPKCLLCFSQAFLSEDNECLICPANCKNCKYDENRNIICLRCNSDYTLNNNGICEKCPLGCNSCYTNENNTLYCNKCYEYYALNSNGECKYCSDIKEIGGEGCEKCRYNKNTAKYECYECKKKENEASNDHINTFVNNTFQCFNNTDQNDEPFYGCLIANYNIEKKQYECLKCNDNFIYIINKKICKSFYQINLFNCYEAEYIENKGKYYCTKCYSNSVQINTNENIINCHKRIDNLIYCLEGYEDKNNNFNCTKCVSNSHFNKNICECDYDSFSKTNEWCYKCDDQYEGIPGCDSSKGCSNSINSNNQLNCNQCKNNYFNYKKHCYYCPNEIQNCEKCHFDNSAQNLICDKCIDEYIYNKEENKCEIKNCEDFPKFLKDVLYVKDILKNINLKVNAKFVNMDILKLKIINVLDVNQKNMEALLVINVNMK